MRRLLILFALFLWATPASAQTNPDSIPFAPAVNYPVGDNPTSVFCADLDGDNDLDLAVANAYSDNVSILKNNGHGTFQSAVNYSTGDGPMRVFCADLDGDGDLDLALTNSGSDNVSILKNSGYGTFPNAVNYGAGDHPYSVFCVDLDGDTDLDLAVTNIDSDNISILRNDGDGTFQSAVNYGTGDGPHTVFCADLDGDTDLDLAVSNAYSDNVSILKNNGDGTFQSAVNYGAGDYPHSVFCADLDGDNDLDLAVANAYSDNVSILKNNGDGTFQSAVNYGGGDYPASVFCADLDGDTDLDLALANWHSDNVSILKNNGDGTFQSTVNYGVGGSTQSVFCADLDGDTDLDLAVQNEYSDNVSVLLNRTVVSDTSLVGYWSFDEGSGDTVHDYSGNSNDGAIYGATWVNAIVNGGLSFDGVDDYVEVPDDSSLDVTSSVTIAGWAYIRDLGSTVWHTLCAKNQLPHYDDRNYGLFINSDGYVDLSYFDESGQNIYLNTPGGTIQVDRWYFIVGIIDPPGAIMKIYIDGQAICSTSVSSSMVAGSSPLYIGKHSSPIAENYANGFIDEVRIYNRALGEDEIRSLYGRQQVVLQPIEALSFQDEGTPEYDDLEKVVSLDAVYAPTPFGSVTQNTYATGTSDAWFDAISLAFDVSGIDKTGSEAGVMEAYIRKGGYYSSWHHFILLPGEKNSSYEDFWPPTTPPLHSFDFQEGWISDTIPSSWVNGDTLKFTLRLWNVQVDVVQLVAWSGTILDPVPNTYITNGPKENEHLDSSSVLFCWVGSDDSTAVESLVYSYKMDDEVWSDFALDTSHTFTGLLEGYRTFMVKAMDGDMNVDSTPAVRHFAVDTTCPNTELIFGPSDSSWIETPFVTFIWTGTDNLTDVHSLKYAFKVDDDTLTDFVSDTSHTFTDLSEGVHTFYCIAKDKAGNEDSTPLTADFWVKFVDLQPTQLTAPDSAQCNRTIEVSWTAANDGDGLVVGTWKDKVYLSDDSLLGGDTYLGGATVFDSLHFQDSYSVTDTLLLPDSLEGDYWIIVKIDEENSICEEGSEDNNAIIAYNRTHISIPPHPDLHVSTIAVPDDGTTGQTIDIEWTVTNLGDTAAEVSWADYVYLSTDAAIGSDTLVATFTFSEGLAVGDSYTHVHSVTIPKNTPDEYWVVLKTDATNKVNEYESESNNSGISGSSVTVRFVDLLPTELVVPDSARCNQPIPVSWTVTNDDLGLVYGIWKDRVYLSVDSAVGVDDVLLGECPISGSVPPGNSYSITDTLWLPDSLEGNYWIILQVDAGDAVYERYNEDNNVLITTHPTFISLPAHPDLQVSSIEVPDDGTAGQTIDISWTVTNFGDTIAEGSWIEYFYLSTDSVIGGDTYVGAFGCTGDLMADESYTDTVSIDIPEAPSDEYWVVVTTDATNQVNEYGLDANNISISGSSFTVKFPDLQPTLLVVPDSAHCNRPIEVSWSATNYDSGLVAGAWTDKFYLSEDSSCTSGTYLGGFAVSESLDIEESYSFTDNVVLPDNLEGDYWICVQIDANNDVYENESESNNALIASHSVSLTLPPHPDLQVQEVEVPVDGWTGQAIDVSWTIINLGEADAVGSWTEYVYLSTDPDIGDDMFVTSFEFTEGLEVGESYTHIHPVPLPEDAPGDYWIIVKTNALNQINEYESDTNNVLISDSSVTAMQSPFPDLVVDSVAAPSSATSGQSIDVSWTITNNGTGATDAPVWYDRVYLSADTIFGGDQQLGSFQNFSYLAPEQSYQQTKTVTLPWELSGPHYILVKADGTNLVNEHTAEENNIGHSSTTSIQYAQEPKPYLVASIIHAPSSAWSGHQISITWEVTNTGDAPAVSFHPFGWDDAMALSEDEYFGAGDYWLGSHFFHTVVLEPGESDTLSVDVYLPAYVSGDYYLLVIPDTHNLTGASGITLGSTHVQISPKPPSDLEVTALSVAEDSIKSGSRIGIAWTVTNNGYVETGYGTWTDAVYVSADPTLQVETDLLMMNKTFTGNVKRDSSYTRTDTVAIPNQLSGPCYLIVYTDRNCNVNEGQTGGENNNWTASSPFEILFTPPDLQVTAIVPPVAAFSGKPASVEWEVTNLGPGRTATTAWHDKVYLSRDDTLDIPGDQLLYDFSHSGALDSAGSYVKITSVTMPNGDSGSYHLYVITDANNNVFEDALEDNNSSSESLWVTLTPPPDLQVTQLLAPDSGLTGFSLNVQWTVSNLGQGSTGAGLWKDKIFLSTNSTHDVSSDTLLFSLSHSDSLRAGQSYAENRNLTLPANDTGSLYLKLSTDAENAIYEHYFETNNIKLVPIHVALPDSDDLRLANLTVTDFQAPETIVAGENLSVAWTVTNPRPFPTPSSVSYWQDAIYLSVDSLLNTQADIKLAQYTHFGVLAADSSYSSNKSVICRDSLVGEYYLFLVTDLSGLIQETNESDNWVKRSTAIELQPPDLRVTSVTAPGSADAGQPITLSWSVINQGTGATKVASWYDAVYLSKDQILDQTDHNLGSLKHQGILKVDSSYSAYLNPQIPPGASGPYYVIVKTDKNNEVYEHNSEGNNYTRTQNAMQVLLPEPVNLIVTGITAPDSAIAGEEVTISWTVTNDSENDIEGQWTDAVYLSSDTVWDYYDPVIGTAQLTTPLRAGKSYSRSVSISIEDFFGNLEGDLPGVVPGDYHVIVRTDLRNNINETDETDNSLASTTSLSAEVSELALGVLYTDSLSTGDKHYYRVEVADEGEDMRITLDCESEDTYSELHVRYSQIPDRINHDYWSDIPFQADHAVTIPDVLMGTYYILVTSDYVAANNPLCNLIVETLQFGVDSITPVHGGDEGFVTVTIFGTCFDSTLDVFLEDSARGVITPQAIRFADENIARATFDFSSSPHGLYDFVITKAGTGEIRLPETFTVEESMSHGVSVVVTGPETVRLGESGQYLVTVENNSNIDAQYVVVRVQAPNIGSLILDSYLLHDYDSQCETCTVDPMNTTDSTKYIQFLLSPGLFPNEKVQLSFQAYNIDIALELRASAGVFTEQEMVAGFFRFTENMRLSLLDSEEDPELVQIAEDSIAWTQLMMDTFYEDGMIGYYNFYVVKSASGSKGSTRGQRLVRSFACAAATRLFCAALTSRFPWLSVPCWLWAFTNCYYYNLICDVVENDEKQCDPDWDEEDQHETNPIQSHDPNEKFGPTGVEGENPIAVNQSLPYTIYFENMSGASAPAIDVTVTDQLDTNLDWRKFRLDEIAFGDNVILVPSDHSYWQTTIGLDSLDLLVEIDAGINAWTGEAHWYFNTIDPLTGQPPLDPFAGFLPPNDSTGRGEGHVTFTIKAEDDVPEGSEIRNSATIVFDTNDPIQTNEVMNVIYTPWPDLVITSVAVQSDSSTLLTGEPALFNATVLNQGLLDSDSFYVKLFLGAPDTGVLIDEARIDILGAGQSEVASLSWTPMYPTEQVTLYFCADYDDSVHEMDEGNNDRTMNVAVSATYMCGDANDNEVADIGDVIYLLNYLFKNGDPPTPLMQAGDVNLDIAVDIGDVVYLLNYLFKNGPLPCVPDYSPPAKPSAPAEVAIYGGGREDDACEIIIDGQFGIDVYGMQLEITWDGKALEPSDVFSTSRTGKLNLYHNSGKEGVLKAGLVDLDGRGCVLAGSGPLLRFNLKAKQNPPDLSSLELVKAILVDEQGHKLPVQIVNRIGQPNLPKAFSLSQNYPNPFNPNTVIEYALPADCHVRVTVYNVLGQKVRTLANEFQKAGYKRVEWDSKNDAGEEVASGVYFYRIKAAEFTESKKMVILK